MKKTIKNLATLFCGDNAPKETISNCCEDFEWLIDCAYDNAFFGYGVGQILTNATAEDYLAYYGGSVKGVILALGRIGWAMCAEDRDYLRKCVEDAKMAICEYRRGEGYLY
jgi:hypothetical protein